MILTQKEKKELKREYKAISAKRNRKYERPDIKGLVHMGVVFDPSGDSWKVYYIIDAKNSEDASAAMSQYVDLGPSTWVSSYDCTGRAF